MRRTNPAATSMHLLQGAIFSKTTAYLRLASSAFDFGLFVPTIGLFIALLSVFCLMGFNILVARRLPQMGGVARIRAEGGDT